MASRNIIQRCGDDYISWQVSIYNGKEDLITISKFDECRTYRVVRDWEFAIKIQKTQIRAIDGASGLFDFLTIFDENCSMGWLRKIWDNCKPINEK